MKAHHSIPLRRHLMTLLLALTSIPTSTALASPLFNRPVITIHTSDVIHLTLQTTEGTERFVLERENSLGDQPAYAGRSRLRSYEKTPTPASLSMSGAKARLYTTSRRTGRPIAIEFFLTNDGKVDTNRPTRVHRVPSTSLACGASAGDDESTPLSLTANQNRRRRTKSKDAPVSAKAIFSPPREIEIATEADYDFYLQRRQDTNPYIRSILTATDALYTRELGLRLKIVNQKVETKGSTNTAPIVAENLLLQFSQNASDGQKVDLRHLFTGRSLQGSTIGIAYIATTCTSQGRYAVGLSRSVNPALQPYLAAHEIAHNLSAVHDGEPNSVMNPAITSANNRFSEKAKTAISQFVSVSGSCLAPEALSDATLSIDQSDPTVFNANATFKSETRQTCSAALYASPDGRRFSKVATRRLTATPGAVTRAAFLGSMPPLSSSQTFSFKVKVTCPNGRRTSNAEKLPVAAAGPTTSTRNSSWITLLRGSLR